MLQKLEKQLVNSKNVYVDFLFNLCLMLILQDMLVYAKKNCIVLTFMEK